MSARPEAAGAEGCGWGGGGGAAGGISTSVTVGDEAAAMLGIVASGVTVCPFDSSVTTAGGGGVATDTGAVEAGLVTGGGSTPAGVMPIATSDEGGDTVGGAVKDCDCCSTVACRVEGGEAGL